MSELVTMTKSHLKQIIPSARNIVVKIDRDHELFVSKIHIHIPGAVLHARKRAKTVWEALDSSYQAVLRQAHRLKTKRETMRKKKFSWNSSPYV